MLGEEAAERAVALREVGEGEGGEGANGAVEPEPVAGTERSGVGAELDEEGCGRDGSANGGEGHRARDR